MSANFKEVSPLEADALLKEPKTIMLDVRTPGEYIKGHLEGAVNVPFKLIEGDAMVPNPDFDAKVAEALPDKSVSVICTCFGGGRGGGAAERLQSAGFKDVSNLVGGMGAWKKSELPGLNGPVEPPFDHKK